MLISECLPGDELDSGRGFVVVSTGKKKAMDTIKINQDPVWKEKLLDKVKL